MHIGPNHPFRQSRHSSSSSNATYSINAEGRRARKENQFIERHGSKLHAYDRDKAPYPCSFDRHVLEVYVLPPLASDASLTLACAANVSTTLS